MCSSSTGAAITSGGGFSVFASRPTWQATAVSAYLRSGAVLPPAADFVSGGRAFPDLAAIGHNLVIVEVRLLVCGRPLIYPLSTRLYRRAEWRHRSRRRHVCFRAYHSRAARMCQCSSASAGALGFVAWRYITLSYIVIFYFLRVVA